MENQVNLGDQNNQQMGQNPVGQPMQLSEKKVNYWMISTFILTAILVVAGFYTFNLKNNYSRSADQQPISIKNPTPTAVAMPTSSELPINWKTYTSSKYNYAITYPQDAQIISGEREDFKIFIKGQEYPLGTYVAVDVIQNSKKLTLKQLGNERFATDAPEPYDLNWKETQFLGMTVLTTKHQPPGDTGEQTIYLFEKNGVIYALWKSPVDQSDSTVFVDLSTQILSTFKFLK